MPKYYNSKYKYNQPEDSADETADDTEQSIGTQNCPNSPDLIPLRAIAAAQRSSIAFYFEAAMNTNFTDIFFTLAEEEMRNFYETMQQISRLDPVQADSLRDAGLTTLVMARAVQTPKGKLCLNNNQDAALAAQTETVNPPARRDLPAIKYLSQALDNSLNTINTLQTFSQQAQDTAVLACFCELMNDKKTQVARLTATLFSITNEPLPDITIQKS